MAQEQPGTPPNGTAATTPARPSRAQILAELNSGAATKRGAAPVPQDDGLMPSGPQSLDAEHLGEHAPLPDPDAPAPAPEEAPAEEPTEEPEAPAEEPVEEPVPEEPAAAKKPDNDPSTLRGLATVQKAEKRMREQIARERSEMRAELERERATYAPRLADLEKFEKAKQGRDYLGMLEAIGFKEDDYEPFARELYLRSPAGQADPKNRAEIQRIAQERAYRQRIAQLEAKVDEVTKGYTSDKEAQEHRRAVDQYLDGVTKLVDAKSPLMAKLIERNPAKARGLIGQVTAMLLEQDPGETPDPADVVAIAEKYRRSELEDLGLDPNAVLPKPAAKAPAKGAAPVSTPAGAKPANPSAPKKTREQLRAEIIRDLESGNVRPRN